MKKTKRSLVVAAALAVVISLTGCAGGSSTGGTPKEGGTARIALNANPVTLDPIMTGAYVTRDVTRNVFESLVTLDADGNVAPLLAESYDVSDDNKTFTFKLRQGVKFHNGAVMTAEDVVASVQRWASQSLVGKTYFGDATVTSPSADTVVIQSAKPLATGLYQMADMNRAMAIMPKSAIDAADATGVKEYIGTGPFKFVSWEKDQNIKLEKFADYKSPEGEANGYAGDRTPHLDALQFDIIPDSNTRLANVTSGTDQVGYALAESQYSQVKNDSTLTAENDPMVEVLLFNKKQGVFATNQKLRQAVLTGLDMSKIAKAAHQSDDLYTLDGGMMPASSSLRSDASLDKYNQGDVEQSKQLVAESGYNGETIHMMANKDYSFMYDGSLEIQQQLKEIGLNVQLDVMDWATQLQKLFVPDAWDMMLTDYSYSSDPTNYAFLQPTGSGWTVSDDLTSINEQINTASTDKEKQAGYDALQNWFYDYVPVVIIDQLEQVSVRTNSLSGYRTGIQGPIFYSLQLTE
ncbi:ABC transporter substrate-binding protein [Pseudoclavibacter sp. 13-3]|uniref:ABC transporter substrate-binding protein n=1 Tax=Pseudoclavibacter sp. 13-3 TaxID=2901228 RepID=UPI001E5A37A6|nr:ABC transporter substrate-binding protein [Pseudoclavibacter sp. 13-3]MCD7101316.1 ABC transporter substrate-binding protein [Pseudoclavibacter sp. 13-3]